MLSKLLAVLITLSCFASTAFADTPSVYVYGGLHSKYVLGAGIVASEGAVAQGGTNFSWKNGMYLDVWGSVPFQSRPENDYGKETDLVVGWKGDTGLLKLDLSLAYYNLYPTRKVGSDDMIDIVGEATLKNPWTVGKATFVPFAKAEVMNSSGRGIHGATQFLAGLYNTIPTGDGWSVKQKFQVGYQPNMPGLSAGWNGYYKVGVERTWNALTVGAQYQRYQPFGLDAGRIPHNVFGVTFGFPLK
jgi:hypothetical protein